MGIHEQNPNLFSQVLGDMHQAGGSGLKLQQEIVRGWTRSWSGSANGREGWPAAYQEVRQQWQRAVLDLARNQWSVLSRNLDNAIDSFETIFGSAGMPEQTTNPLNEVRAGQATDRGPEPTVPQKKKKLKEAGRSSPGADMNIAQRVAVVTGAASGIGAAVAEDLARRGARAVLMVDLDEQAHEVAESINKSLEREVAQAIVGDTSDAGFRGQVFDDATARHGLVSICVPAAGITRDALSVRIDKDTGKPVIYPVDDFRKVTEINLIAPTYWAIEMVARIAESRHSRGLKRWTPTEEMEGAIVFLGSVSSQGNKGQISYAVAKAGLEGAAATLMKEAIFHGVRCAIIHPGFTDTPMARALGEEYLQKKVLPFTQLGRLIRPEEIADAVCFMISNSAVSGELWADAGWHPSV